MFFNHVPLNFDHLPVGNKTNDTKREKTIDVPNYFIEFISIIWTASNNKNSKNNTLISDTKWCKVLKFGKQLFSLKSLIYQVRNLYRRKD